MQLAAADIIMSTNYLYFMLGTKWGFNYASNEPFNVLCSDIDPLLIVIKNTCSTNNMKCHMALVIVTGIFNFVAELGTGLFSVYSKKKCITWLNLCWTALGFSLLAWMRLWKQAFSYCVCGRACDSLYRNISVWKLHFSLSLCFHSSWPASV